MSEEAVIRPHLHIRVTFEKLLLYYVQLLIEGIFLHYIGNHYWSIALHSCEVLQTGPEFYIQTLAEIDFQVKRAGLEVVVSRHRIHVYY